MEKNKKRFGDRKDAKRIHNLNGLSQLNIDLKPKRSVSDVFINQEMDITNLVKYIEKKKKAGEKISFFHAFVTAFGKTYYLRPKMNRFVANRHIYEHNDVVLSFVAKESFDDHSEEIMVLIKVDPEDNIYSIADKIETKVGNIRSHKSGERTGANKAMEVFGKMPNILRVPLVGLFKFMDKIGKLPNAFIEDNIYYSSLIVSNLGSIGCDSIFHNINDFGTCSGLCTMGIIREVERENKSGKLEKRHVVNFGVNLDERIADGYYFSKTLSVVQRLLDNPELLEGRCDEQIETKEIR